MAKLEEQKPARRTPGLILHSANRYDLLVWLFTFGRERSFREKMLRPAHLQAGEVVLDVGCGTGTLAIMAARKVGPTGAAYGIDASPEMIARAIRKTRQQGVQVNFQVGAAQELPFPNAEFDIVLTTLMLHHLPRPSRQQLAHEIKRVLKPGGRVIAVDFAEGGHSRTGLLRHLHRPHGHTKLQDIVAPLSDAGLTIVESGAVGMKNLHFVRAMALDEAMLASDGFSRKIEALEQPAGFARSDSGGSPIKHSSSHPWKVVIVVGAAIAAALHVGVAASLFGGGMDLTPTTTPSFAGVAVVALLLVVLKAAYIMRRYFKRRR